MNYTNWSLEYDEEAQLLKEHMKKLRQELKHKKSSDVKEINRRLSLMYPMYLEMKHIAQHLRELDKEVHIANAQKFYFSK